LYHVGQNLSRLKTHEELREAERLFLDLIKDARDYRYIENQYFTSPDIADAMIKSLEKNDGPGLFFLDLSRVSFYFSVVMRT